jgi:hypothetical protein
VLNKLVHDSLRYLDNTSHHFCLRSMRKPCIALVVERLVVVALEVEHSDWHVCPHLDVLDIVKMKACDKHPTTHAHIVDEQV